MALVKRLNERELALVEIFKHPVWCSEFLRSLDEEGERLEEEWEYTIYQKEFLCDFNSFVSICCGRSVGKTVSIMDKLVWFCINKFWNETIVYTVPARVHLEPVFLRLTNWFRKHFLLKHYTGRTGINSQNFTIKLNNGVTVDCRIAGQSGTGANVVGLHVPIILLDEAGFYPWGTWIELLPTLNTWQSGFQLIVSGVPTGLREKNVLYFTDQVDKTFTTHQISAHENPRYTEADEVRNIKQYGGVDGDDYIHMVLGQHGAPSFSMFDREKMALENYSVFRATLTGQKIKEDNTHLFRFYNSLPAVPSSSKGIMFGVDLGYCYSEDTEVLTSRGWMKHTSIIKKDTVACFDPETHKLVWDKPLYLWEQDYVGDMIEVDGRSTNFMVSPEHSVFVSKTFGDTPQQYTELKAKELLTLSNNRFRVKIAAQSDTCYGPDTFKLPYYYCDRSDRDDSVKEVSMSVWLQFLGWFISEGSATANRNWEVNITQGVNKYAAEIDLLFSKMPYIVSRREAKTSAGNTQVSWRITCKSLCMWLREQCGVGSKNKKIPDFVFNCSTTDKELFLRTLLMGDGSHLNCGNESPAYISSSELLLDQVQHLALSLGYASTKSFYAQDAIGRVSVMNRTENTLYRDTSVKKVPYNGKIYCLKTTTGFYVTRRKGKPAFQGNTEDTVIMIMNRAKEQGPWRFLARITLKQVTYPQQEAILDTLDSHFNPRILAVDEGSAGKSLVQHLQIDDKYKRKKYKERLIPIAFRSNIQIGVDADGEPIEVRAKQFGMQLLQSKANNHDIIFSKMDEALIGELERTTYSKTSSGELVFKALTPKGGTRKAKDHNTAALICFVLGVYLTEELDDYLWNKRVILFRTQWV